MAETNRPPPTDDAASEPTRELVILVRPDYRSPEASRRTAHEIFEALQRHAERCRARGEEDKRRGRSD